MMHPVLLGELARIRSAELRREADAARAMHLIGDAEIGAAHRARARAIAVVAAAAVAGLLRLVVG